MRPFTPQRIRKNSPAAKTFILIVIGLTAFCSLNGKPQADSTAEILKKRRSDLRLELAKTRADLLKTDAEIAAIERRIQALYRELDAALSSRPAIRRLREELEEIEKAIVLEQAGKGENSEGESDQ